MATRYAGPARAQRGSDTVSPEVVDRILLGACAAVWLVLIGVSVAASVALTDLARGFHKSANSPHTTWVLYTVIVVSALIIAGAIPVLLRARRGARSESAARPSSPSARAAAGRPIRGNPTFSLPSERTQAWPPAEWSGAEVDRVWLRGAVALTGAIGIALTAAATATYLMAVGHDGVSWICYGLAGVITAGLPAIEWLYVRQIRRVVAEQ